MTLQQPLWMQHTGGDPAVDYSGQELRAMLSAMLRAEGVMQGGLKISQRGAGANFSVDMAVGSCAVQGDDVANQGIYLAVADAVVNVVTPTAPGSGTRVHRVVAQIRDKFHNGSWTTYDWTPVLLQDTGTGTPATPASALNLARVSIGVGQANVSDANITDDRVDAAVVGGQFPQAASNAGRSANPFTSEINWRTDRGYFEVWSGSAWALLGPQPQPVTAVDTDAGTTTSTSLTTALTGAAANVSVAFIAPSSGKALVRAMAFMKSDLAGIDMYFGARITVTSGGATFYTPTDQELAKCDPDRFVTCMNEYIVTGLTPGTSYTAVGVHKVQAGGTTGNYDDRRITVTPI